MAILFARRDRTRLTDRLVSSFPHTGSMPINSQRHAVQAFVFLHIPRPCGFRNGSCDSGITAKPDLSKCLKDDSFSPSLWRIGLTAHKIPCYPIKERAIGGERGGFLVHIYEQGRPQGTGFDPGGVPPALDRQVFSRCCYISGLSQPGAGMPLVGADGRTLGRGGRPA